MSMPKSINVTSHKLHKGNKELSKMNEYEVLQQLQEEDNQNTKN
jgi:hypothetical protein